MADFPPNPEDGELWLPSDVFLEIVSTTTVQNKNKNLVHGPPTTLKSSAYVAPKNQKCDAFCGVKPNGKNPIGKRDPSVNHGSHPWWSHGFQVVSGPFNVYHSKITIPTHQAQGFKNGQAMFVHGKSEGTGVFLPRFKKSPSKEIGVLPRGTGVFLNHQVMDKNKNGGEKNDQEFKKKKQFGKDESEENKRFESQLTHDNQISLPKEWTYSAL
ncbi:unnamed protein product [Dovyalis caffra]|uniref:Uncharacterized protein n=1 Tax=Dovyalis caffra TaxID=77055 RepID=A0AAV1QVS7_9ROSI|nr:unnamed protein product [Dovyalis caffra]